MVKNNLKLVKLFLFCFICILGMIIFINKSAVYADEGKLVVISSDKQQLKKEDILTYSIDMPTNEDVMAAMLTIKYDDAKIEPLYAQSDIGKSIQPGSVLNSSTSDYNIDSDGNIKIVMVSNSDKIATGNICMMSFKVKPNTTGNIDINVEKCETCNNEIFSNSTTILNKASVMIQTEKTETSEDKISLDKTATSIGAGKSEYVEAKGLNSAYRAEWIIRRILELGGNENVDASAKADVFGFDIADVSGSIKLFSDVMRKLEIKLNGDELYEEFQRIYDEAVSRDTHKEKAEDKLWNGGRGRYFLCGFVL